MKDAATDEKYEGLDMQRKVKKIEDKKATNPFELGENDEDSELEEDSEEDSEEGFDGEKFTDGKAGSERFNEGLLADSLHVEAEVERKVSPKVSPLCPCTAAWCVARCTCAVVSHSPSLCCDADRRNCFKHLCQDGQGRRFAH